MNAVNSSSQNVATAEQPLIDFSRLYFVLNRAKWRILSFATLVTVLVAFVVLAIRPQYSSTSTLLIESQQARAIKIDEVYGINSGQQEYYLTQFEILNSRFLAERVVKQLNLANHPDFQDEPSIVASLRSHIPFLPQAQPLSSDEQLRVSQERLINSFTKRLTIAPVRKTQLVKINFETYDPILAAAIANALGEAYIDSQLEAKMGITQKANSWLGGRLGELREQLNDSERKLELYRSANNLVDVEGVTTLDAKELTRLSDEITVARAKYAQIDSFLQVVQRFGKVDIARLESLPEVTSHPSVQNVKKDLVIVERKVSELSKIYGPKHPKMIAAQSELSAVHDSLREQIANLVRGIEDEAQSAKQNLANLESQFAQAKTGFSQLSSVETEYRRLLREVETNRQLFDSFLARQKETAVTGDFDSPVARFTDRATIAIEPSKPKRKLFIIIAFVMSLGFAMVLALVIDLLNDTLKTTSDVESVVAQRALGFIPKSAKKATQEQKDVAFFDANNKQHSEAVRSLRTSLSLLALDKPSKILAITSSNPAEGKTTVCINLAFAYAALERVLVIDADMRKPTLGPRIGVPAYQPGLANFLSGTESIDECIVSDVKPNVDVLAAGAIPLNPLELLLMPEFSELLLSLSARYDRILIDTPPVQAVSDALVLAGKADGVVVVVKANHTRSGVVKNSLAKLNQAHGKVFGVVLNQLNTKDVGNYYGQYGYYHSYEQQS